MRILTYGSLASGIGGLDLAVEAVLGVEQIWHAEYDKNPSKIHEHHWPGIPNLGDITKIDWSEVERPDIICGGYPCQPFSSAGKRQGFEDVRNLWPYFADAIRTLRPNLVILENVAAHLSLGFGQVLGDLAEIGYDAEWGVFRASEVGAPHRRERVFIVAYTPDERRETDSFSQRTPAQTFKYDLASFPWRRFERAIRRWESIRGEYAPIPLDQGILNPEFVEWMMGYEIGWTEGISRTGLLKALGNAVLPQQGELAVRTLTERMRR